MYSHGPPGSLSSSVSQLVTTSMQALSVTVHATGVSLASALVSFVLHMICHKVYFIFCIIVRVDMTVCSHAVPS